MNDQTKNRIREEWKNLNVDSLRHYRDKDDNLVHCNCDDELFWKNVKDFIDELLKSQKESRDKELVEKLEKGEYRFITNTMPQYAIGKYIYEDDIINLIKE